MIEKFIFMLVFSKLTNHYNIKMSHYTLIKSINVKDQLVSISKEILVNSFQQAITIIGMKEIKKTFKVQKRLKYRIKLYCIINKEVEKLYSID